MHGPLAAADMKLATGDKLGCPSRMQVKGAVEFIAVAAQQ